MATSRNRLELDSAILRLEMLKCPQLTSQAKAGDDDGSALEIDGKCVRIDPRQRELAKNPFGQERY